MLAGSFAALKTLAIVILGVSPSGGQPWARFRRPNGCGEIEAATIPVQWTAKDYRWTVKLPGLGHSSPVVWGDKLIVTTASADGTRLSVHCFGTIDGTAIWDRTMAIGPYPKSQLNSYASTTPAIDGQRVYVTWAAPKRYLVAALALDDGRELWRREFDPFGSEHGLGASPIVWEDLVIVPNDQDGPSGKVHWRQRVGGDYFSSPVRVADRIYCPSRSGEMVVLAAADRFQQLARFPLGDKTHSTPAVADGAMYLRTFSQLAAIGETSLTQRRDGAKESR